MKRAPEHHMMRVRVRYSIFEKLRLAAERESERRKESISVSDLVRAACYDWLFKYESVERMESMPWDVWRREEEADLYIITAPML